MLSTLVCMCYSGILGKILINNGNRTKWSPFWSVIIQVIDKIGQVQSGSLIWLSRV